MPKLDRNGKPLLLNKTLTRRSMMEWLGKGAVVALGSGISAACDLPVDGAFNDGADAGSGGADSGATGGLNPCKGSGDGFSFEPGSADGEIFKDWREITVDPQDLEEILKSWRLRVDGMVQEPMTLTFDDILKLTRRDQVTDLHCGEGWSVFDIPWNGAHFSDIFKLVKPRTEASYVVFHTVGDIYDESIPFDVALEPKTILAYGVDCSTLPFRHGFPLRLVLPRKWGYKSAKYIYRIELSDEPLFGYWTRFGFPYDADIPEERLRPGKY